jgi:hypothetical protein
LFWLRLLAFSVDIHLPVLWLLRLHFRSKDAVGLPILVLCVVLLLIRVDIFALLLVSVLVLVDRLRVIELMPHVLILFVAHLPRATLLSPLLLLAVAVVVVLRVVRIGFHGTPRAPPGSAEFPHCQCCSQCTCCNPLDIAASRTYPRLSGKSDLCLLNATATSVVYY